MNGIPDHFWEDLLIYIEEGQVIPIVGEELAVLPEGPLHRVVAEHLAEDLKIPPDRWPKDLRLDHVVGLHAPFRERRASLYPRVKTVLDRLRPPVPDPLRKLARILPLRLYVSTTFDSLLAQALNEERFQGRPQTRILSCSPGHLYDLETDAPRADEATVFHLFGKACASPDYVVTDCDRLEFMHALQSPKSRPQRLFDRLRESHLLFLGTGFPDWLARFFLRLVKSDCLWRLREKIEVVADAQVRRDEPLTFFLDQFSQETSVFSEGGPIEFVDQLYARWCDRVGVPTEPVDSRPPGPEPGPSVDPPDMPTGAVFVSYASEDRREAESLCSALEQAGIDVWFDRRQMRGGDAYESKIRQHIRKCSVFVPLVSRHTETDEPRFFRKEWKWACDRLDEFTGTKRAFVVPVVVDGTAFAAAEQLPDAFRTLHAIPAPGGVPPEGLTQVLQPLIRQHRKREQAGSPRI
jgi:hypothetical protein